MVLPVLLLGATFDDESAGVSFVALRTFLILLLILCLDIGLQLAVLQSKVALQRLRLEL
jgi:hypothetical protein